MGQRLPGLFLLIAAGVVLWMLLAGDAPERLAPEELTGLELGASDSGGPEPGVLPAADEHPAEPLAEARPGASEGESGPALDPDSGAPDPSVGSLELRVTDKQGHLLGPEGVSARILYVRQPARPAVQGVVDAQGAIFRFLELPLGAVRVHVEGDLVLPGVVHTTIRAGEAAQRTLAVGRAGAVQYDVQFADGSRPGDVQLRLTGEAETPVRASYRPNRLEDVRLRSQRGRLVRVPPEGVIYGLRAGTYTLNAVAQGGAAGNFQGASTLGVSLGGTGHVIVLLER